MVLSGLLISERKKEDPEFSATSSSENLVPSYSWDTEIVEMLYSDYLNIIYGIYTASVLKQLLSLCAPKWTECSLFFFLSLH